MSCLSVEDIVYPHNAACYGWTAAGQLICTPECRREHQRAWKVRREQETISTGYPGAGLAGQSYWVIYRRLPYSRRYSAAAAANTFADVLALLARPFSIPEQDDHVPA